MKNAKQLWQEYVDFIERNLDEKSSHLTLALFSVAWLKSNYQSFQKNDIDRIHRNERFNANLVNYAIEHQALTAWQTYQSQKNWIMTERTTIFKTLKSDSLIDWVEHLCVEGLYPTLRLDCFHCGNWGLKPIADSKGNVGYFCNICMQSFSEYLDLKADEYSRPMTLTDIDNANLTHLLFPNPLHTK